MLLDVGVGGPGGDLVVVVWVGQFPVDVPLEEARVLAVGQQVLAPLLGRVERRQVGRDHGELGDLPGRGVQVDLVWGSEKVWTSFINTGSFSWQHS